MQVEREVVGPHDRERPRVVPAAPRCVRDEPDDDPAATEERPRDDEIDADEEPRDVVLVQEEAGRSDEQRLHADRAGHPEELARDRARPVDVVDARDGSSADPQQERQGDERPVPRDRVQPWERAP